MMDIRSYAFILSQLFSHIFYFCLLLLYSKIFFELFFQIIHLLFFMVAYYLTLLFIFFISSFIFSSFLIHFIFIFIFKFIRILLFDFSFCPHQLFLLCGYSSYLKYSDKTNYNFCYISSLLELSLFSHGSYLFIYFYLFNLIPLFFGVSFSEMVYYYPFIFKNKILDGYVIQVK